LLIQVPHPSDAHFEWHLKHDLACLQAERDSLQAERATIETKLAAKMTTLFHIELYKKNNDRILTDLRRVVPHPLNITSERVEDLWDVLPDSFKTTPTGISKASHEALFDTLIPRLLQALGRAHFAYQRQLHVGSKPGWMLTDNRDFSACWQTVVVTCTLHAWNGNDSVNNQYKEGMGQEMEHMARQWSATGQSEIVGVFSNSRQLEIIRRVVTGTDGTAHFYTSGLLPFLTAAPAPARPTDGFRALVQLLASSPAQLGRAANMTTRVPLRLGGHLSLEARLGRGDSSDVYTADICEEAVAVKVYQSPVDSDPSTIIARDHSYEQTVLDDLGGTGMPPSVPKVHTQSYPEHCLITTPVGEPLTSAVEKCILTPVKAASLAADLCAALTWAHGNGWIHLDVRPTNVIIAGDRAVLVDWASALKEGTEGIGLRGTATDAPDDMVRGALQNQAYAWIAHPSLDWESLRYLYMSLVDKMFQECQLAYTRGTLSTEEYLIQRASFVTRHLGDAGVVYIVGAEAQERKCRTVLLRTLEHAVK
jgi:hypothetical protein